MIDIRVAIPVLLTCLCFDGALWSQESSPASSSLESFRRAIDRLEAATAESKKITKIEELFPQTDSRAKPNSAVSGISSLLNSISQDERKEDVLFGLDQESDSPSDDIDEILYKLDLLKKLKSRKDSPLETIDPSDNNPLRVESMGPKNDPQMPRDTAFTTPESENQTNSSAPPPVNTEQLPARPVATPFSDAQNVISGPGPMNPFEMGNSLFQTGKIELALNTYKAVDMAKLSVFDAAWLRYMMATCHRKLGNVQEADGLYRQISEEKSISVLVNSSQWWLDQNTLTSRFDEMINAADAELQLLEERKEGIENQ